MEGEARFGGEDMDAAYACVLVGTKPTHPWTDVLCQRCWGGPSRQAGCFDGLGDWFFLPFCCCFHLSWIDVCCCPHRQNGTAEWSTWRGKGLTWI